MSDKFFASTSTKRKRPLRSRSTPSQLRSKRAKVTGTKRPGQPHKGPQVDEELESDATHSDIDDLELRASDVDPLESDREEDVNETPAEKRLRLAKIYLESVKEGLAQGEGEFDAAEIDRDIISARLKEDVLENAGKVHVYIAESITLRDHLPSRLRIKGHRMPITSAVLSHDARKIYLAGKEGTVSCYDVASGKRLSYAPKSRPQGSVASQNGSRKHKGKDRGFTAEMDGHSDEVLALALSGDGRYLVSAGKDRRVGVWDISDDGEASGGEQSPGRLVWVKGFSGHKDSITAVSFRKSTNMLYSASSDRTIKLFDLSPGVMGYVETLFGHQDSVTGLDSLKGDTALSCGGRDRTVRFWKIADETQLVFRGGGTGKSKSLDVLEDILDEEDNVETEKSRKRKGKERWVEGSIDCVAMVDEQNFLSGSDSGSIALWSTTKKKPIFTYPTAHGLDQIQSSTEGRLQQPRWITSLACLRYADLFASGSWDGHIRLWKIDRSLRSFSSVGSVVAPGLINSLQLLAMPKGWTLDERWSHARKTTSRTDTVLTNGNSSHIATTNGETTQSQNAGVLLVAAVGQEPRLGRWIKLKGDGVVNSALIFSLRRQKFT